MKVLVITGSYPPAKCGVGDYSYRLIQALAGRSDVAVAVIVDKRFPYNKSDRRITIFDVVENWGFLDFMAIRRVVRDWKPDVVHIQYPTQGYHRAFLPWCLPTLLELDGAKVVQTWHESFEFLRRPIMSMKALSSGPIIVVRSNYWDLFKGITRHLKSRKRTHYIRSAPSIHPSHLSSAALSALRRKHLEEGQVRLLSYFGFIYPNKGVEQLFEIADPARDKILIIGQFDPDRAYCRHLEHIANQSAWSGKVEFLGFLPPEQVSDLLAASDAVVLPFPTGGGDWNTSIQAGRVNGSFVLTTSTTMNGYDAEENIYYAKPNHVAELVIALDEYAGKKSAITPNFYEDEWERVAAEHLAVYQSACTGSA